MKIRTRLFVGVAALLIGIGVPALIAQGQRGGGSVDPSAALLQEVRGLRAELGEFSRASLRAQLLVARVQLQEQRIIYFDRQRADLATNIATAAERTRSALSEVQRIEDRIKTTGAASPSLQAQLAKANQDADAVRSVEQLLRSQEATATSGLKTEQARWNDFNTRLDELEKTLPPH